MHGKRSAAALKSAILKPSDPMKTSYRGITNCWPSQCPIWRPPSPRRLRWRCAECPGCAWSSQERSQWVRILAGGISIRLVLARRRPRQALVQWGTVPFESGLQGSCEVGQQPPAIRVIEPSCGNRLSADMDRLLQIGDVTKFFESDPQYVDEICERLGPIWVCRWPVVFCSPCDLAISTRRWCAAVKPDNATGAHQSPPTASAPVAQCPYDHL
jgi:hypothetical protein